MRIDGFQNISSALQSLKSQRDTNQQSEKLSSHPVEFSSFAQTLKALQRQASSDASNRANKVEKLTQKEQSGKLHVDYQKLAGALLDNQLFGI